MARNVTHQMDNQLWGIQNWFKDKATQKTQGILRDIDCRTSRIKRLGVLFRDLWVEKEAIDTRSVSSVNGKLWQIENWLWLWWVIERICQ